MGGGGGGVSFYFKMIPSQGNLDLSAKVGEVQCSYIVTCQNIFGVLCTGRVLCKYVNYLPLLYYITYMYAVLLWVNILTYNIKYYHMQSPALFKNIFKFCTFLTKFSNILPFFKKLHAYPLSIIGPEYANWLWKKHILRRKKSCITIKQNFVQTSTVINQVFVTITSPLLPRQFASFYCW